MRSCITGENIKKEKLKPLRIEEENSLYKETKTSLYKEQIKNMSNIRNFILI